ncbi:MAG: TonB-dependent receptor [Bacteroidales bacterium]|nr:TonB-dependent receptor [Bacteroidales bacterium]
MKKIRLLMAAVALVLSVGIASAQNVQVRGTVTDASTGEPVPFASIQVKGTMQGTATDALGSYAISVPGNGVLVFSSIGYTTLEVAVNNRGQINVSLEPETEFLDDVIVVGYGTVRREAKTGSIATLEAENLAEAPVNSVDKMLAGKMAGVMVTSQTGQPGANSNIRIRGISSVNAGNEPLWVVDGIPVMSGDQGYFTNTSNAMAVVNPNDIESITVLKDAAAASIYGSRAANGVILVTTKSGSQGKAKFQVRAKYGISQLANDNNFRVLTGSELIGLRRQAAMNAGMNPDNPTSAGYYPLSRLTGPQTNWLKEVTKLGNMQEYEINASAGNDRGKLYSSLSYQNTEGITYASQFNKIVGRVNTDYKLTNSLTFGARVNMAYTYNRDTEMQALYYANPFFAGLSILPWTPLYDEYGNYNVNIPENSNTNPMYNMLSGGEVQWEKQFRNQASVYLEWQPVTGLVFKTNNMLETTNGEGRRYWGPDPGYTEGTLQVSTSQYIRMTTSNTATYNTTFGDAHSFRAMIGQEAMKETYHSYFSYSPTVDDAIPYPTTSIATDDKIDYSYSAETLLSFFGNVDYSYDQRYYLQGSVRADGSSLFGSANRWGLFWSASGSWNISNEAFMSGIDWLSLLKLRASYGVNGNNNIAAYRAYGVYASTAYNGASGMLPSDPDNPNLSWEKNYTWNVGLDFAFFDSRINGQVDVYSRDTKDMLLNKSVPQTSGFSSNFVNIGALNNKGVEFQLNGDIIRTKDFNWNVGFNLAYNKSTILDLGDTDELNNADSRIKHKVGKSFYTYYLKDYYGVNPSTGQALWRAADPADPDNEDAFILTSNYNKARYIYAGSPEPKFTGGFNTSLSWKGFDLSAFFEYKLGNNVLIVENRYVNSDGNQNMNQTYRALNYWKEPGDTGVFPKPYIGNSSNSYAMPSTRWMERGDYLRVKDVTLSYTFPTRIIEKIKLGGLKLYVSGLNLYTFHDVNWFDPERGVNGMGSGIYPMTKTLVGGVEVSF